MKKVYHTTQFKKDCKRIGKQGRPTDELRWVIRKLAAGERLEERHRDHKLRGRWNQHRECHVGQALLLIYRMDDADLVLERTGTHAELFE